MSKPSDNQEINQLHSIILESLKEKKAEDLLSIDFKVLKHSLCDYFIIAHGNSSTQVHAMAENVLEKVKKGLGLNATYKEGFENSEWIILDYLDIVVHLFKEDSRRYYDLESLWADANLAHYQD